MEPSWNLTSRPPRTTPEPIWAETPKLSAVGEKRKTEGHCGGVQVLKQKMHSFLWARSFARPGCKLSRCSERRRWRYSVDHLFPPEASAPNRYPRLVSPHVAAEATSSLVETQKPRAEMLVEETLLILEVAATNSFPVRQDQLNQVAKVNGMLQAARRLWHLATVK